MSLSDRYRGRQSIFPSSSSPTSNYNIGGLAGRYRKKLNDPTKELDSRISNAQTRLQDQGIEPPAPSSHKGLFQKLLDALNYLNNKKNQGLYMATHGTNVWDTPSEVTGQELLKDWTGGDFKGSGLAGFGFDAITDPLNLLSFGTAGAASQLAKAGVKGGLAARYALKGGDGGNALTKMLMGAGKETVKKEPTDSFLHRLLGPEGEQLREIQNEALRIADKQGLSPDHPITELERSIAEQKGLNLEDLYNKVYREAPRSDIGKAPGSSQLDTLPIDEAAPKPWLTSGYTKAGKVEEVSVDWLSKIKGNPLRHTDERMKEIEADIRKNGFKEPLLIMIGQQDRKIRLGEGNHRLEIAKRLGYKYVPVRVMRQQKLLEGEELAGEAMSKVPKDDYFPGDAKPSDVFDTVEVKPVVNASNEIAAGQQALVPPEDFARAGPPGSVKPGALLGGATDAAIQGSNKWFAQLGGHIPFTDIGGYVKIPGSEAVLGALGAGASKVLGGVKDQLSKIPGATKFGEAVKDLVGRNLKVGYGVPGEVNQITQRMAELTRMDNKDIVDSLVKMRKGWEDQAGYIEGIDDLDIIRAIEEPMHADTLRPDLQKVVESVRNFFDIHYAKARDDEVIEDFTANYLPHIFKAPQADIEAGLEQMRRSGVRIKTTTGSAIGRIIDKPLTEILADPQLVKQLNPEKNLIKIMAVYKSSLEKAIRNKDMLAQLTSLGPDIMRKATYEYADGKGGYKTVKAHIPSGWVKAPVAQLKNYWTTPEMANHLKDITEPFINNVGFKKLAEYYDSVLGWWKGMATVPNIGFQVRNQMGNMFNNYLAGVRTLDNYMLARQAQNSEDTIMDSFYDIVRLFTEKQAPHTQGLPSTYVAGNVPGPAVFGGGDFKIAMLERIFNHNRLKARFFEGDGPKIKVMYDGKEHEMNMTGIKFFAKFYGVTGLGYFGADLGEEVMKKLSVGTSLQKFNPLSTKNALFKFAEEKGNFLEDNARLAHFISKLRTDGGNMEKAAESVKKYLFDYSRLTPTEKGFFKRVMPFYAFTRNNMPLQLRELVKQPKYASMMATFQNWTDAMAEESTDTPMDRADIPKFINQLYSVRLPFQVGHEARDIMLGFDTPNRDVNNLDPRELTSMLSPLISVPLELVANRNFYTGRDLEAYQGETVRAPGYLQGAFDLFQFAGPDDPDANIFNQFFQWAGATVATNDDGSPELRISPYVSQLLNQLVFAKNAGKAVDFISGDTNDPFGISSMLTGVSGVSSTEDQRQTNSKYNQLQALEDLLRKMKDEGSPVPTLSDIQKQDPGYRLAQLLGGR